MKMKDKDGVTEVVLDDIDTDAVIKAVLDRADVSASPAEVAAELEKLVPMGVPGVDLYPVEIEIDPVFEEEEIEESKKLMADLEAGHDFGKILKARVSGSMKKKMVPDMSMEDAKSTYAELKELYGDIEEEMVVEEKEMESVEDVIDGLGLLFDDIQPRIHRVWHMNQEEVDLLLYLIENLPTQEGTVAWKNTELWREGIDDMLEAVAIRLGELEEEQE